MTEMVFGHVAAARSSEPILTRWWRTVDRWRLNLNALARASSKRTAFKP